MIYGFVHVCVCVCVQNVAHVSELNPHQFRPAPFQVLNSPGHTASYFCLLTQAAKIMNRTHSGQSVSYSQGHLYGL